MLYFSSFVFCSHLLYFAGGWRGALVWFAPSFLSSLMNLFTPFFYLSYIFCWLDWKTPEMAAVVYSFTLSRVWSTLTPLTVSWMYSFAVTFWSSNSTDYSLSSVREEMEGEGEEEEKVITETYTFPTNTKRNYTAKEVGLQTSLKHMSTSSIHTKYVSSLFIIFLSSG